MKHGNRFAILLVILLGYLLRVLRLDWQELRGDEAFGYFFSLRSYQDIITDTLALSEPHPVLSYWIQHSWLALAGHGEFALRYLGLLFSVLAIAILFRLMVETKLPSVIAAVGALLLAVSPYAIWHSQDARMYSMSMVLTLATSLLMVIWVRRPRTGTAVFYIVVSLAALHSHYFAVFVLTAQSLYILSQWLSRRCSFSIVVRWAGIQLMIILLYVPWYLAARHVFAGYAGNGDSPAFVEAIYRAIAVFSVGETVPISERPIWAVVGLLAGGIGLASVIWLRKYRDAAWFYGLYLVIPVVAAWYGSVSRPIFNERYLAAAAPPFFALVACSLLPVYRWRQRMQMGERNTSVQSTTAIATIGVVLLLTVGSLLSLSRYTVDPAYSKTRGWRELANRLEQLGGCMPRDTLMLAQNYPDPTLWYYYAGDAPHLVLPPQAHDEVMARAEVSALLDAGVEHVLLVEQPSPNWDSESIARSALNARYSLIATDHLTNWPILIYSQESSSLSTRNVRFKNGVELLGYDVGPQPMSAGAVLPVVLAWHVPASVDSSLKVFVQIIDSDGRLVAQHDSPLVTTDQTGQDTEQDTEQVESYGILLPVDMPAGQYTLISGLYNPDEGGQRQRTVEERDHVVLEQLAVVDEGKCPATETTETGDD